MVDEVIRDTLGKPVSEVIKAFGEAMASYEYRGVTIYVFDAAPFSAIAVQDGKVIKVDGIADKRRMQRVQVEQDTAILIARPDGRVHYHGTIEDISVAALRMDIRSGGVPNALAGDSFVLNFHLLGNSVRVAAHVIRCENRQIVLRFQPSAPEVVQRYVALKQLEKVLSGRSF